MSCILYFLKCCFGPTGCSSLCIGPIRESSTTRLMYSITLIIVSITLIISHENKIIQWAANEFNSTFNQTCIFIRAEPSCQRLAGYKAVYRIAFPFFFFHLVMALLCTCISNSQEWRARIHNGFWFFKFFFITGIWTLLFLIPMLDDVVYIATIIGVVAALMFIIIQHVSLIDCAYEFNGYLRQKSSDNCCFTIVLYIISVLLYIATVGAYILIYFQFAVPRFCVKNRVVILVNASASLILVIFSFCVSKRIQYKLYIPGGVTSLFVAFLTWTAISSAPDNLISLNEAVSSSQLRMVRAYNNKSRIFLCRPKNQFFETNFGQELHAYLGIFIMLITAVYSSIKSTINYKQYGIKPSKSKILSLPQLSVIPEDFEMQELQKKSKHRISGSFLSTPSGDKNMNIFKFSSMPNVNVTNSKKKIDSKKSKAKKTSQTNLTQINSISSKSKIIKKRVRSKSERVANIDDLSSIAEENWGNVQTSPIDEYLIHDEYYAVRYSYSWMHFIYALAYLFVMVQLTNWYSPETSHILKFSGTWPSMWMKITTSWVALGLFGWSLLFPAFCIGRKLYEFPLDSMKRYRKNVTQTLA